MATKKAASKAQAKVKKIVKAETEQKTAENKKNIKANGSLVSSIVKQISQPDLLASLVIEFIGTFLLVAGIITTSGQPVSILFILMAIVLFANRISGAHVNPLITLGAWATRRISTVKMVGYMFVQFLGSVLALSVLSSFAQKAAQVASDASAQLNTRGAYGLFKIQSIPEGQELMILLAELLGAFIFSFIAATIVSAKKKEDSAVALGVAGGLFMALIIAGSMANVLGGVSVINPAVAVGLQALSNPEIKFNWAASIYIGAPLIGGVLGFALNSLLEKAAGDK